MNFYGFLNTIRGVGVNTMVVIIYNLASFLFGYSRNEFLLYLSNG